MPSGPDRQRIDKWLWHARLARTRGAAQELATSGRVRLNRERIGSSSQAVKIGDVLTVAFDRHVRVVQVKAFAARRGPAAEAQRLYDDLSPPVPEGQRGASAPAAAGRPAKHDRRLAIELKRSGAGGGDFPGDGD
jgi:ribosome-associated heat shock protein Hsp15